jgi:fumarylacetoacetate (FAA) hydrolase family protein
LEFTAEMLPNDAAQALLAGRLLLDEGPTPVLIREGRVEDVSRAAPTIADLMDLADPASVSGDRLFGMEELANLRAEQFLAPCDLQAVKGAGARRFPPGGRDPRSARTAHRRRDPLGRARKRGRGAAQGSADRR